MKLLNALFTVGVAHAGVAPANCSSYADVSYVGVPFDGFNKTCAGDADYGMASEVCGYIGMLGGLSTCCTTILSAPVKLDCSGTADNNTFATCTSPCLSDCTRQAFACIDAAGDCDNATRVATCLNGLTCSNDFVVRAKGTYSFIQDGLCGGTCPSDLLLKMAPLMSTDMVLAYLVGNCTKDVEFMSQGPMSSDALGALACIEEGLKIGASCVNCVMGAVIEGTNYFKDGKFPGADFAFNPALQRCIPVPVLTTTSAANTTTTSAANTTTTKRPAGATSSAYSTSAAFAAFAVVVASLW